MNSNFISYLQFCKYKLQYVGFSKNYEHQEVIDILVQQNYFLKQFSTVNSIGDHINVFSVRPIRGKTDVFQAFANISQTLREGFQTYGNKVTIGLSACKIYDQFHVKRCNNCQSFGHYYRNCPTPNVCVCAKCAGDHSTRECESHAMKCINCVKAQFPVHDCAHGADDRNCLSIRKAQEKIKNNLNLRR